MGDWKRLVASDHSVLHKADSGAMRFKLRNSNKDVYPTMTFTAKQNPQARLCKIAIRNYNERSSRMSDDAGPDTFTEFWMTWHSKTIEVGLAGETEPFITQKTDNKDCIGFIQFDVVTQDSTVDWIIEASPVTIKQVSTKCFDGELTWAPMNGDKLPPNAVIGGFEKGPIYVARASHNGALCPGKYVPTDKAAYVPCGDKEWTKMEFEILCGDNVKWVKTSKNVIPPDAFVAGYSEQRDSLYVGRAMHEGCLVVGKVHYRYEACFLPYYSKEIGTSEYEILTVPKITYNVPLRLTLEE